MVNNSFCHTAAYPKPVDILTHEELPDFFAQRGGVALHPGDGIILLNVKLGFIRAFGEGWRSGMMEKK